MTTLYVSYCQIYFNILFSLSNIMKYNFQNIESNQIQDILQKILK